MPLWSGERLRQELPSLVTDFHESRIDCAAYRLRVGDQAFVTGDQHQGGGFADPLIASLGAPPRHTIRIAPGQFGFLLTMEEVTVPPQAIALISMRTGYKFKGLINVSGFHVDPGWKGKLIYSVYNAGPSEIILSRGDAMFMIVYADLDKPTADLYRGKSQGQSSIDPGLLQNMTSQVFSPQALQHQLREVNAKMGRIELSTGIAAGVAAALAVMTGIVIATVALLPSWTGVVVARTLDAANYEIKQKTEKAEGGSRSRPDAPKESASAPPPPVRKSSG